MAKKPPPTFVIRFVGGDIKPELVPLGTLMGALRAVQRLMANEEMDAEADEATLIPIHLLDVGRSSASYKVYSEDKGQALEALRRVGNLLQAPHDAISSYALSPVETLSDIARMLGVSIELSGVADDTGVLATVRHDTYEQVSYGAFIEGATSIYGRIERVGGATSLHCGIRPHDQHKQIRCAVASTEVLKKLGQYIQEDVVVTGFAVWYRDTWRMKSFKVTGVEPPKTGTLVDTMRKLRLAGGDAWDTHLDRQKRLREIRGE